MPRSRFFHRCFVLAAAAVACGGWSTGRAATLVVNEMRSDSAGRGFVELFNAGGETADLSGWSLAGAVQLVIPKGTALAPGAYLVLHVDGLALQEGTLRLLDGAPATGAVVDQVAWPEAGARSSLELVNPKLDNARARAWLPSLQDGGTPGALNSRFSDAPFVIEEIPARGGAGSALTEIAVTFSEEVGNVTASTLAVNGVPALGVRGSGAGPYVFSLPSRVQGGTMHVVLEGDTFADDAWEYFDPPTTLLSMPDNVQGGPGATVQVPISAAPGGGIFGIDMTLSYAPAVLQAQSVVVSGVALTRGFGIAANLGTPGTIVISEYATSNDLGAAGGEIARINFLVLGAPGASSAVGWTSASINEGAIPVAFDPGLVTVNCSGAANGTACDDGNACTTADSCQAGVCSGGITLQVPSEVADLRFDADKTTLRWTSAAGAGPGTVHDALRGLVGQFPVGSGPAEACLASGVSTDFTSDASSPAGGAAQWYLVRGRNACGTGTYGFRTSGGIPVTERTSTQCP